MNLINILSEGLIWYIVAITIIVGSFFYFDYKLKKISRDSDKRILEIVNRYKIPSSLAALIIFLGIDDLFNNNS